MKSEILKIKIQEYFQDGCPDGVLSDLLIYAKQALEECEKERAKLHEQREMYYDMLHSICEKAFGMDDTKSGEPYNEYILRQVAKVKSERDEWEKRSEELEELGLNAVDALARMDK